MPGRKLSQPTTYRYRRLAELAVGTTGRVDLCRLASGPHEGRLVAVKRLHQHIAGDPHFIDLLQTGLDEVAGLQHPNIAAIIDSGDDGEGPLWATDYIRGVSLARLRRTMSSTGEQLDTKVALCLLTRICLGLRAAHRSTAADGRPRSLVHRDLSLKNVMLGFEGEVKILSFGLTEAKRYALANHASQRDNSPGCLAPEQLRGNPVDHRTDIFALGVLMFELLTSREPWEASSPAELSQAILEQPALSLAQLRPTLDSDLAELVQGCLHRLKKSRPQSAAELYAQLQSIQLGLGQDRDAVKPLARFARRNCLRRMRWLDSIITKTPLLPDEGTPPASEAASLPLQAAPQPGETRLIAGRAQPAEAPPPRRPNDKRQRQALLLASLLRCPDEQLARFSEQVTGQGGPAAAERLGRVRRILEALGDAVEANEEERWHWVGDVWRGLVFRAEAAAEAAAAEADADPDDDPQAATVRLARAQLPLPVCEPPALTLEQYAWLCAETALFPELAREANRKYGIADARTRSALDRQWQDRFSAEPELGTAWQALLSHCQSWLREQQPK